MNVALAYAKMEMLVEHPSMWQVHEPKEKHARR